MKNWFMRLFCKHNAQESLGKFYKVRKSMMYYDIYQMQVLRCTSCGKVELKVTGKQCGLNGYEADKYKRIYLNNKYDNILQSTIYTSNKEVRVLVNNVK